MFSPIYLLTKSFPNIISAEVPIGIGKASSEMGASDKQKYDPTAMQYIEKNRLFMLAIVNEDYSMLNDQSSK